MEQLFEFVSRHPYLVSGAVIVTILIVVTEVRLRREGGTGLSPNEAIRLSNHGALVLDVRDSEQFAQGHIQNARHIAFADLADSLEKLKKQKQKPVLVYCDTGGISARAVALMRRSGFEQVFSLRAGLTDWRRDNLPLVKN